MLNEVEYFKFDYYKFWNSFKEEYKNKPTGAMQLDSSLKSDKGLILDLDGCIFDFQLRTLELKVRNLEGNKLILLYSFITDSVFYVHGY